MEGEAVVESGDSCMLLLRGKGTRNFYALGLDGENAVIACCETANGRSWQLSRMDGSAVKRCGSGQRPKAATCAC